MRRIGLTGLAILMSWFLSVPAVLGQVQPAPQPFELSVDSAVDQSSDLPGPRVENTLAGTLSYPGFNGEVQGTYTILDLVGPCGNLGRIVTSLVLCPVDMDLSAVTPGGLLEVQCSLLGSGSDADDLLLSGRCVVKVPDQSIHGTGDVEGVFDGESGEMSFTIVGEATCRSLNPKDCLSD